MHLAVEMRGRFLADPTLDVAGSSSSIRRWSSPANAPVRNATTSCGGPLISANWVSYTSQTARPITSARCSSRRASRRDARREPAATSLSTVQAAVTIEGIVES